MYDDWSDRAKNVLSNETPGIERAIVLQRGQVLIIFKYILTQISPLFCTSHFCNDVNLVKPVINASACRGNTISTAVVTS